MESSGGPHGLARERILGLSILGILFPLELAAASLTFETVGELASGFAFLLVFLNLPLAAFVVWRPLTGSLLAVLLALAILPRQVVLGHRLLGLREESAAIVAWVYEQHRRSGEFPPDLDEYEPKRSELLPFLTYTPDRSRGGFLLVFSVGTPSTSHGFSPATGWWYYPD